MKLGLQVRGTVAGAASVTRRPRGPTTLGASTDREVFDNTGANDLPFCCVFSDSDPIIRTTSPNELQRTMPMPRAALIAASSRRRKTCGCYRWRGSARLVRRTAAEP
jgi:hypothetical protein